MPIELLTNDISLAIGAAFALGLLLLAVRPMDRTSVRNVLLLLLVLTALALCAQWLASSPYANVTRWAAAAAAFGVGTVLIRFGSMLMFRVVLPRLHMAMPRIVDDLATTALSVAWLIYWLYGLGLDPASLVTTSAVITAVLAFSMQDTLGNILGGLVLQLDDSIRVGDWVKVDDVSGQVVDVRWRHTAIETRNRETVVIPNGWLVKNRFQLIGARADAKPLWRRWVWLDIDASAAPNRVLKVLEDAIRGADIPNVVRDPAPTAVLMETGARVMRYAVRYWMDNPRADDPTDTHVRVHVLAALARNNIRLALKQEARTLLQGEDDVRSAAELARRREALEGIALFATLSSAELDSLATGLVPAPFVEGDTITRQGAVAHWLYMIVSGHADVWYDENGVRTHIASLGPGSVFGEMGMMTGEPRSSTVTARTDVDCLRLDKTAFEHILRSRPDIAEEISTIIVERRLELAQARDEAQRTTSLSQRDQVLARIRGFFGLDSH